MLHFIIQGLCYYKKYVDVCSADHAVYLFIYLSICNTIGVRSRDTTAV